MVAGTAIPAPVRFKALWDQDAPRDLPVPVIGQKGVSSEVRFAKDTLGRQWQFDVAWPPVQVALEFEGGVFGRSRGKPCPYCGETPKGRHTTGSGFIRDLQKYNAARALDWIVMQYAVPIFDESPGIVLDEMVAIVTARKLALDQRAHLSAEMHTALDYLRGLEAALARDESPHSVWVGSLVAGLASVEDALSRPLFYPLSKLETFGRVVRPRTRRASRSRQAR